MEWVETTGPTVDQAKEVALDQLGVAEDDAEFEVVQQAQTGLFGRLRREARVRARVRPVQPPPKAERRRSDRRRRGGRGRDRETAGGDEKAPAEDDRPAGRRQRSPKARREEDSEPRPTGTTEEGAPSSPTVPESETEEASSAGARRSSDSKPRARGDRFSTKKGKPMSEVGLDEHGELLREFVDGLVEAFDLDAEVVLVTIDDENAEVQIEGEDLGLLIGPRGQTLQAIQSLGRTVVQRRAAGRPEGRVNIDVAGYRQRRRAALEDFVERLSASVLETGTEKSLEPMGAADRKIVHDTVNGIEGLHTISEGEEPRRRVVLVPDAD